MRFFNVRVENVSVNFGGIFAVKNLNISVEPGEIVGILGPKGSGKTTFVKLLLGIIKPSEGHIQVLGNKVNKLNKKSKIGFMLPIHRFLSILSAYHYLQLMGFIYRKKINKSNLEELATRFGVNLNKKILKMNASEINALQLLFAFLEPVDLIILDEPIKNIRQQTYDWYHREIKLARANGVSIIFTTNSISEIERICDWVVLMQNGQFISIERGVQFRGKSFRRVEMRFANPIQEDMFSSLPNISNLYFDGNKMRCLLTGAPDLLIKRASEMRVTDFTSTPPTLDETFALYRSSDLV